MADQKKLVPSSYNWFSAIYDRLPPEVFDPPLSPERREQYLASLQRSIDNRKKYEDHWADPNLKLEPVYGNAHTAAIRDKDPEVFDPPLKPKQLAHYLAIREEIRRHKAEGKSYTYDYPEDMEIIWEHMDDEPGKKDGK